RMAVVRTCAGRARAHELERDLVRVGGQRERRMRREHDSGELGAEQALEDREFNARALIVSELVEQAAKTRLVVLLVVEAQLTNEAVDPRLERRQRGIGDLLRDVVECEPAMQELEHDGPGLVEMVIARGEHVLSTFRALGLSSLRYLPERRCSFYATRDDVGAALAIACRRSFRSRRERGGSRNAPEARCRKVPDARAVCSRTVQRCTASLGAGARATPRLGAAPG